MNNILKNVLPPLVNQQTKVMIIGSMPGVQSLEKEQYYGHPRNHFWPIIAQIVNEEVPEQYEQRLIWLKRHRIGLWDAIQSCEREGSLDTKIKNEVPNDFVWLFATYPQIEAIFFNGTKAQAVFKKHLGFSILQHRFYTQLPSSSPVPGKYNKTFDEKVVLWRAITPYLQ